MSLLITFWNGDSTQFDECDGIDFALGLVRIYQNHECYEYDEGGFKEIIFVNEYTLSHAIDEGYVM
jgi:hypothetical protein